MNAWGAGLIASLAWAGVLIAQPTTAPLAPNQKPTTRTQDCTSGGCHAPQVNKKFLHGPNAVGACDACHEVKDLAQHTFGLKREGKELCNFCHIDKTGTEGPVVHKPLADGLCLGCHDPHGSVSPKMLKKDTTTELCQTCHPQVISAKHVHKPAGEDCAKCHKPHTANEAHLLTMPSRQLCLSCHADVGKSITGAKHPHDPTKGECLQCHTPHASNEVRILKASPQALCTTCHPKPAEIASHASFAHSPVTNERACLNCHVPHGSDSTKQLAADPVASCLTCHSKAIVVSKDKTIPGVPELANAKLAKHGPINQGDCAACHAVHGGDRAYMLTANYSMGFYQAFSDDAYALCLKCHRKELVTAQPADNNQTGFRDGQRNLHALHVNRGDSGRSCRACHTMHVSQFPQQINNAVPFGEWKLPINFKPSATGGSCSPGCHKPFSYERTKDGSPGASPSPTKAGVVNTSVTPPAPHPTPAAPPAEREEITLPPR